MKNIIDQLARDGRTFTTDIHISREFGRMCSELEDKGFVFIARTERNKKTVFVTPPEVRIVPLKNKKYKFYRVL